MDLQEFLFWLVASLTGLCAIAVVVTQNIVRAAAWLLFALAGTSGVFFLLGADFVGSTQLLVYVGGTLVLVVFGVMLTAQGPFISMKTGAAEWAVAMIAGLLLYGVLAVSILSPGALATLETDSQEIDKLIKQLGSAKVVEQQEAYRRLQVIGEAARKPLQNAADDDSQPEAVRQQAKALLEEPARMGDPARSMSSATLGEAMLGLEVATPPGNLSGAKFRDPNEPKKELPKNRTQMSYFLPFEIVSVHLLVVLIGAAYLARAKRRRGTVS